MDAPAFLTSSPRNDAWKLESRAWPRRLDKTLGNPADACRCGHTRDHHGMVLGVNGRGQCNQCRHKKCKTCGHELTGCAKFTLKKRAPKGS